MGRRKDPLLDICLEAKGAGLACGYGRRISEHREGGLRVSMVPLLSSLWLLSSPTLLLHGSTSPSPILPLRSQV